MMDNENVKQILKAEDSSLLNILDELERTLKTEGDAWKKKISELAPQVISALNQRRFSSGESVEKQVYSAKAEYWAANQPLMALHQQYQFAIALQYFKYLELPSTKIQDLTNLYERYQKFMDAFSDIDYIDISKNNNWSADSFWTSKSYSYSSRISIKFYEYHANERYLLIEFIPDYSHSLNWILEKSRPSYLKNLFVKFSAHIPNQSSDKFSLKLPSYITSPLIFSSPKDLNNVGVNFFTMHPNQPALDFNGLVKGSLIARIVFAVFLDNPSILKLFFEEYKTHHPEQSLQDLIANHALVGLAAANGCVEVMKFLITMKVNLEQKFTLNISYINLQSINPKSVLTKHEESTLEMSPLALALSAAPALPMEKARTMIDVLLKARANYNNKVIKTWSYEHGYYNNPQTSQKSSVITLFNFDQTGILSELVNKLSATKPISRKEKTNVSSNKNSSMDVFPDNSQLIKLQSEFDKLKKRNVSLEEEVAKLKLENQTLKQEVETLKSPLFKPQKLMPDESATLVQAAARGFFARKEYKETIEKEVKKMEKEIKQKLVDAGKDDELIEFIQAVKKEDWFKAMEIIHTITATDSQIAQLN